jgi:hypothetical protein
MYECDNCGCRYPATNKLKHVFPDIPDLLQRLDPGGTVPAGECPACGALVYPVRGRINVVLMMDGGLVHEVVTGSDDVDVMILDQDVEGAEEDEIVHVQRGDETLEAVPCFPQHTLDPEWADQIARRFSQ